MFDGLSCGAGWNLGSSECAVFLFGIEQGSGSIAVAAVGMWKSGLWAISKGGGGDSDEAEHDSGGKSNRIPVRSRTAIGAKRRWYFNCGISVRLGQRAEPSEHPPERSGGRDAQAGKGFGERRSVSTTLRHQLG